MDIAAIADQLQEDAVLDRFAACQLLHFADCFLRADILIKGIVFDDQRSFLFHVSQELVHLQADQPAFCTQFTQVGHQFLLDLQHHLIAVQHLKNIAVGHKLFKLKDPEACDALLQHHFVFLKRLDCLVGFCENDGDVFQCISEMALVECDDCPPL
ncbi:Uncharacterised protein [Mycobacteroides abscessus subsp. abscessus]|nr:Uncharacterised protein [Mycobacteroides abscessus subsp. abscessus]